MQKKGANISLKGYDDIFSTDQSRAEAQQERVQEIPLSELHPFEGHPFRVVDDEEMMKTVESVRDFGVLTPAIVRPDPYGGYEIISGHRRHRASELAGKETMPAIVRDMDDDAAIILMVDSNLQRETLLPSERAFAYRMKLDAIKHQGQTCGQVGHKSRDIEGELVQYFRIIDEQGIGFYYNLDRNDRFNFLSDICIQYFRTLPLKERWMKQFGDSIKKLDFAKVGIDLSNLPDLVNMAFHTFPAPSVDNVPVHAEQVVDNKKVTDHHAIIPTRELQKCNLNELPKGELAILQLISTRLFVAVGDPHRYAETVIELDCGGTAFSAKGKTILHDGWKALAGNSSSTKSDEKEQALPSVSVGDEIAVISTEIKEGKTSPPKHYTEDTLLQSMETAGADEMPDEVERKGLGTPATRAGIIEKLVRIGFLERKGDKKTKHLIPTHKGTALVTVMPEQIQSPSMTADWEEKLLLIEKGEYASEDFMDEIKDVIAGLIQNYEVIQDSEVLMSKESNTVGKCPVCGDAVEEKAKAFFCSNRSCKFALWKNNRYFESIGKSMTSATAQKLLGSGKIKLKGCKSAKTGNTFDATVYMEVFEDGNDSEYRQEKRTGKRRKETSPVNQNATVYAPVGV